MDNKYEQDLDKEWVELICAAKRLGLSIEEIRTFIEQASVKKRWAIS